MNENLNLCKILSGCPVGTKLYCTFLGDVILESINLYSITIRYDEDSGKLDLRSDGKYFEQGECIIFPSKYQRDWSKFKIPIKRFDPKDFKPFDKVLVRQTENYLWRIDFFSNFIPPQFVRTMKYNGGYLVIPYNEETKSLLDATNDCPEYYKWWEK